MADLIQEQATTYTPGENDLVYNTVVTMGSYSSPQPVVIKQYDSLPIIAAKMRKDGNDYQVPDGAAVNIRLHKRSGTFIYSSVKGISQDRKIAYIQLTSNMTAVYGRTMPCLEIVVNGSVACTGDMVWDIQRNPVQEDDVKDTSEGQYIQEMAAQVQAFEDTYQEALDYMNNATNQSRINNAASNAQAAQQAATNAANSADEAEEEANRAATESAKALGFRSFHGGQVVPGATDGDLDPSRPMSTPTAASVTIKARGDRIAGLSMAGKTAQAGTGDPSPDNIRMIDGIGMYDKTVVLDGSADWYAFSQAPGVYFSDIPIDTTGINNSIIKTNSKKYAYYDSMTSLKQSEFSVQHPPGYTRICVRVDANSTSVQTAKDYFNSRPLAVWLRSVDFYKSKGSFYTVVELSADPYRAVGFGLNQPLFDGDSLKVGGKSGFDRMVVLDGSENWILEQPNSNEAQRAYIDLGVGNEADNYDAGASSRNFNFNEASIGNSTLRFYFSVNKLDRLEIHGHSSYFNLYGFSSAQKIKDFFSASPTIIFYRSVNYTKEADIPVALESHAMGYAVWDGTGRMADVLNLGEVTRGNTAVKISTKNEVSGFARNASCSHFRKLNDWTSNTEHFYINNYFYLFVANSRLDSTDLAGLKAWLAAQYSAGTPVQVIYELATPVTYARPVPAMIAQPGEDGTFTVTGENSLSVLLKPFQDGGNAARLEGHTWDDIMAAIDQKIASLASTVMEVN